MAEAFNKIGFHVGPGGNPTGIGDWMQRLDAAGIPFFLKSVDNYGPLFEAAAITRASGVPHSLVFRLSTWGQNDGLQYDVPPYDMTPADAAAFHWTITKNKLPPEFDKELVWVEPINEIDKNRADWLGHFAAEIGQLALQDGYKVTLFGWSSGEPEPEHWQTAGMRRYLTMCAQHPDRLAVSLHEYSYTLDDIRDQFPYKVGRFQALFDACDTMNLARPTVHITEWGWTHEEVPAVDRALADIDNIAGLYAQHPQIKGAATWYLGQGYADIADLAQRLIGPLTEFTLTKRYQVQPSPNPNPNPNPNPAPPPGGLDDYLWQESKAYAAVHGVQYIDQLGLHKELTAREYEVVHRELTRQHNGKTYAIQQGVNAAGETVLGIWTSGEPLRFIVEGEGLPAPPSLPHIDRPLGIDVSHWNSPLNWQTAKEQGVWYAFIKATERTDWADPTFATNWQNSKAAGILRGAYHFYRHAPDPEAQAEWFYNTVRAAGDLGELPPVLDVEVEGGPADFADRVKRCLARMAQLFGRKPLLYMSKYYGNKYLKTITPADADLWIASWTSNANPYMPSGWSNWRFWQYTSDGDGRKYGAQSARLDLNRWNGTLVELYEYAGNPTPVPPPVPAPPPPGNKIDLVPYFVTNQPLGVLYEVQTEGAGQQRHQTQVAGNVFYHTKDGEWEQLKYDNDFIYRGIDTSPGSGNYYRLNDVGNPLWSRWAAQRMALGEVFERKPTITFARKSDCAVLSVDSVTNYLKLTAVHASYTFFTGITLSDVIELEWRNTPNGPFEERYWYAADYGLVGFQTPGNRAAISEIHAPGARPDNAREGGCFSD